MAMTSEAKRALSTTIRSLRARLLGDLHDAAESTYRLSIRTQDARLDETRRVRRGRLESWFREQMRAQPTNGAKDKNLRSEADFRRAVEAQAAYTLLNRLVILRLMEAGVDGAEPLLAPAVVTGGWESPAYRAFRELAPALVRDDETEGYAFLMQLVFEDLSTELPGLFGSTGMADLIPVPAATLRAVVEALDAEALESCWTDDMTLGWVYQYWNDPERERIDAQLNAGGKVAPHEIASKTQMFTERYMVDWLLQNSLGPMWLAMCRQYGWTPDVEAVDAHGQSVLRRLEARRVDWRAKRDAGAVSLTELMPLHSDAERRWAYYVPQPIPDDAAAQSPDSVRDLKLIDPAVGSGHFLVVAMDLLFALYREEARHRGVAGESDWTDRAIVERILSHNLHGIDLDPRAVQIAAAALWLKARRLAPDARPEQMNLVASNLRLASLADDDPALGELRQQVEQETGIPAGLTDAIVHALKGADHLGSLLKVERAVDEAIAAHDEAVAAQFTPQQLSLVGATPAQQAQIPFEAAVVKQSLVDRLEAFLERHTGGDDLGLRLRGEQLAAGVRFVRLVREGRYDLVVANPPYQGTSKMVDSAYVEQTYPLGKADLYAAFLLRGLQLARTGGVSAMLTMRTWMFIKQYAALREHLLPSHDLRMLGDFAVGAFDEVPNDLLSVTASVVRRARPQTRASVGLQPTPPQDRSYDRERTKRKRAATLCQFARYEFDPSALSVIPDWPLLYWWSASQMTRYRERPLMKSVAETRKGICTGNDLRFHRVPHEPHFSQIWLNRSFAERLTPVSAQWVPSVMGGKGRRWLEPVASIVRWNRSGLEVKCDNQFKWGSYTKRVQSEDCYFARGISFTPIGNDFSARLHRYRGLFTNSGLATFAADPPTVMLHMNRSWSVGVLNDLAPGIRFDVGDVERLPVFPVTDGAEVSAVLEHSFSDHEAHREPSVEFRTVGPSTWRHAQEWAQAAVDRSESEPLRPYKPQYDPEPPSDHLSFALGASLGRFGPNSEGIIDPATADLSHALPAGILFLDRTLTADDHRDGLGHAAARPIHEAWEKHRPAIETTRKAVRDWLALDFFKDVHKGMYENRPIHWPLSSNDKTFVAWVNIHRFTGQTLRLLLADHLHPALARIEGELNDLREAREGADRKAARKAEKRYADVVEARDELQQFIADVEQCADRGAPPADTDPAKCPRREQDARYDPDLDDGVMINAAGLWPLLEPQWKDPKKWWRELSAAQGKKDYDWSHLAMRYWPTRVDDKCQKDPSLGVAHGCFWRYHPARAWAWELRLQDEIGPDFRIEEAPYRPGGRALGDTGDRPHRDAWLREHPQEALAAVEKEALRRIRKSKDVATLAEMHTLEPGLWSALPGAVWDMELRLAEKQGADFRLAAPDESSARAAYEAAFPARVAARAELLEDLVPHQGLPVDADDDDDDSTGNTAADGDDDAGGEEIDA